MPIGNDQVYSMASIDGKEVGAIYQMWPEQEGQGVPTHWGNYVPSRILKSPYDGFIKLDYSQALGFS